MNQNQKIVRYLQLALGVWIAFSANSCKKYLEPAAVSSFSADYVFSNIQNAQKAVYAAYSSLEGDNGYGIRVSMYYAYDNDEMIGMHQTGDGDRGDIAHFTLNAVNGQLYQPWVQMYQGIERANNCIYYIPKMSLYTTGTTQQQQELQRLYGEALTLRATFFLELIRNWGDVPAQFLPSAFEPNLFLAKTDRDTIYNQLLNDLQLAEGLVPWRTDIGPLGDPPNERITKGAVKGLRARIALYRGGYSLRRGSSIYGQKMARPADYLTYYKIADQECSDLLARRDEHTLNPSYLNVFKNGFDAHSPDAFGEIMYEVGMTGGSGTNDSKLGYYDGNKNNSNGNAAIGVLPPYFYLFDSTDLRRDVTTAAYDVKADQLTLTGRTLATLVEAKFRKEWISNPVPPNTQVQYMGVDWPIMRFSDVLLMYAETQNEINNGPTAPGIAALQEVQKRGHGGNAALIGTPPSDHDGFFNAVVKERSLEFGGEGIRKYDLIRWNLIASRLADAKTNITNMSNRTGTFAGNYAFNSLDFSQVPDSVFYKTTSTTATGMQWGNSLYVPRTVSSISGTTKMAWAISSNKNVLLPTGSSNAYAVGFQANHSELMPIPQSAIDADFNLKQDYGY